MYEIFLKLLKERGVKASDVSRATGIPQSTFSDWKSGRSKPKDEKLQKIADFFGVSSYYLRTGRQFGEMDRNAVMGAINQVLVATGAEEEAKEKMLAAYNQGYYTDPEAAASAQTAFDDPDIRMLLDAARGAKSKDIKMAANLLRRLKETNPDG